MEKMEIEMEIEREKMEMGMEIESESESSFFLFFETLEHHFHFHSLLHRLFVWGRARKMERDCESKRNKESHEWTWRGGGAEEGEDFLVCILYGT
jgi:hypothetical protein